MLLGKCSEYVLDIIINRLRQLEAANRARQGNMLPMSGTIWLQRSSQTRSKPFRRGPSAPFTLVYMTPYRYTSAIFLADLPTMSDRRDQLAENYSNPQCSLHPPYITFFPLLGNIHLSLNYESPQNFLVSPPEPKNTSHSSHMLSPTIRLHNCFFQCIYCFFVFVCVLSFTILFSLWLLLLINDIYLISNLSRVKHCCTRHIVQSACRSGATIGATS